MVQEPSEVVSANLAKVYELGSVLGSNADEAGFGRRYADDFLGFIEASPKMTTRSVLEIGCGNGYLLHRMRSTMFSEAVGIEPGPQGQEGAARFGVEIVQDFFPSQKLAGRQFSAIVLASVLEHVEDPVTLAGQLVKYLEPSGRIFVSVPDEESYIVKGDISTLFHEHWSYFDSETLVSTMAMSGLMTERLQLSGYGGSIYAELSVGPVDIVPAGEADRACARATDYIRRAQTNCQSLADVCRKRVANGRSLGIYVPSRFVNAMKVGGISSEGMRFFDDDPALAGTYYPGVPVVVEARESLLRRPVDTLIVMSRTFGAALKGSLVGQVPTTTEILLISEIID